MTEKEYQQPPEDVSASAALRSSDERTWAALAHACALLNFVAGLGGLIGAAAVWFVKKEESEWIAFHGLQSLAFQAAQFVVTLVIVGGTWILGFAFSFFTLGFGTLIAVPFMFLTFFLGVLVMAGGLVYSLYGAYRIYDGEEFRYLWLGDWIAARTDETEPRGHGASSTEPRQRNTLLVVVVVAMILVLCVLGVVAGVVLAAVLGGLVYWSSSAFVPMPLYLV